MAIVGSSNLDPKLAGLDDVGTFWAMLANFAQRRPILVRFQPTSGEIG